MDEIVQIISTVGFPIAACVFLYIHMEKEREAHKEEMKQMTEALNNNTLAIQSLHDSISRLSD